MTKQQRTQRIMTATAAAELGDPQPLKQILGEIVSAAEMPTQTAPELSTQVELLAKILNGVILTTYPPRPSFECSRSTYPVNRSLRDQ